MTKKTSKKPISNNINNNASNNANHDMKPISPTIADKNRIRKEIYAIEDLIDNREY